MSGVEILAAAKAANELTKEHQKSAFNWFMITFFGPHYLKYLTRSLVIEGVAKAEAEKQIAQFSDDPHPAMAFMRSEAEIEYQNMFGVLEKTLPKIDTGNPEERNIDMDKMKRLKDLSKEFSSNDMQEVISGILAGEYNQPGSFSLKTMDTVKSLSRDDVELFKKFCGLVINGDFILSDFTGSEGKDLRRDAGLQYTDLLMLQELGLLSFRDSSLTLSLISTDPENPLGQTVFEMGGKNLFLRYKSEKNIRIFTLTIAGKELRTILDFQVPQFYLDWINDRIKSQGFETEFLGQPN